MPNLGKDTDQFIQQVYSSQKSKALAVLIRLLGDMETAEDALQEAFYIALQKWPGQGIPKKPLNWLISAAKFRGIDGIRKQSRELLSHDLSIFEGENSEYSLDILDSQVEDDQLKLIYYCCCPGLPLESRIALSLKEVCNMPAQQIARAFFISEESLRKRISRAKKYLRDEQIEYELPSLGDFPSRLKDILHVIYLVYNQAYSHPELDSLQLNREALFFAREIVRLAPSSESYGLLALLLLHESRAESRKDSQGHLVSIQFQNRGEWNRDYIQEGLENLNKSIFSGRLGYYAIQAMISAIHGGADSFEDTNWAQIVNYYDLLLKIQVNSVIELNRAIALGMAQGPQEGLDTLMNLETKGVLAQSHIFWAARADMNRRLQNLKASKDAYHRALKLCDTEEQRWSLTQELEKIEKELFSCPKHGASID